MNNVTDKKLVRSVGFVLLLSIICLVSFFPIFWIFTTAFKAPADVMCSPPKIFFTPTVDNFRAVLAAIYSADCACRRQYRQGLQGNAAGNLQFDKR